MKAEPMLTLTATSSISTSLARGNSSEETLLFSAIMTLGLWL